MVGVGSGGGAASTTTLEPWGVPLMVVLGTHSFQLPTLANLLKGVCGSHFGHLGIEGGV